MATYNTAFGSLPGTNEMLGTTNTTGGGRQQVYDPQAQQRKQKQQQAQAQTSQTFAQLQQQGMARPAPQAPQAKPVQQYGGSQQGQQMRQQLQQQLQSFGAAPSRFDTQAFQQIRGAQAQNLQAEYQGQQKALNEDLARRGLFASSIGGGRLGDLAGQQARALAGLDAELLGRAADTQAADRAQLLSAGQGFAELAGSQDLQQFEANRVGQAAEFEQGLRSAEFGQRQFAEGSDIALRAGQAAQDYEKFTRDQELREAELLGEVGGRGTLAARQQSEQARQFDLEQGLRSRLGLGGMELERDRFEADRDYRADQLGLNRDELTMRANQIVEDQRLRGVEINNEDAYREAELEARTTQIANEFDISGRQITVDEARIKAQKEIAEADNTAQLARLEAQQTFQGGEASLERTFRTNQQTNEQTFQRGETALDRQLRERLGLTEATGQLFNVDSSGNVVQGGGQTLQARQLAFQNAQRLSEQSGVQYTVDATGNPVVLRDAQDNPVRTSAFTQAEEARKQQASQFNVSQFGAAGEPTQGATTLAAQEAAAQRSQIAFQNAARLSEQSGVQYTVNAQGQPEVLRDAQGNPVRTSTFTQAEEARKQQERISTLDINLRRQLGLTEATGQMYNINPDTGRAEVAPGGGLTVQARQLAFQNAARLSEQSGVQYTVDATGNVVQEKGADGRPLPTNEASQANLDRQLRSSGQEFDQALQRARQLSETTGFQYEPKLNRETGKLEAQAILDQTGAQRVATPVSQANLDRQLRQQLGMTEATGTIYDATGTATKFGTLESRLREAGITGKFGEQTTLAGSELSFNQAAERARQLAQTTGFQYDPIFNPATGRFDVQAITNQDGSQRLNVGASEALGFIGGQQTIAAQNASSQRRIAEDQNMATLLAALRAALGK
jgi:hypothetical protein